MRRKRLYAAPAVVLIASMPMLFSTAVPAALPADQAGENPQITRLLDDAREKAAVVSRESDELEALTGTDATWHAHVDALNRMKAHVNDLGKAVEKLTAARDSASPWQRQAIDRMIPLMRELAANMNAAINHISQQPNRPTSPSYAEYLKENTEIAHKLSNMISEFVEYGQARQKLQTLEHRLEIASN